MDSDFLEHATKFHEHDAAIMDLHNQVDLLRNQLGYVEHLLDETCNIETDLVNLAREMVEAVRELLDYLRSQDIEVEPEEIFSERVYELLFGEETVHA